MKRLEWMLDELEGWLLPFCAIAALIIGIVGVGRFLRLDEANSVLIAGHSAARIFEYLRNDNNLPLYYLLLHAWTRIAGTSEPAVHLLSVVFYFLGAAATYLLGLEVSGSRRGAVYSSFFYVVSLQAIHQAQKARMYSLLGFVAALSTLFFFRVLWRKTAARWDWLVYVLIHAIGTFVHVWYFFVLLAHAVCGLIFQPGKWRSLATALVASVLPFLALWARFVPHQAEIGAVDWMPHIHLSAFLTVFAEFYGGRKWGLVFLLAVFGICIAGFKKRESEPMPYRPIAALVSIAVLCTVVPLFVSVVRPIYWPGRYTMVALPAFAATLGCLLAALGNSKLRAPFAYGVLLLILGFHIRTRTEVFENSSNVFPDAQSDKAISAEICQNAAPGDALVFTGLARAGVEYYLQRFGCAQKLQLFSVPADTDQHLGWARAPSAPETESEADRIAKSFLQGDQKHNRLWLIPAENREPDRILLTNVFDRELGTGTPILVRGSFFDEVLVYNHNSDSLMPAANGTH